MSDIELTVLARRHGRVGLLTLNRPRALNALTLEMVGLIADALESWREDPAVHAVVLTAAGERAFCAGGDIREIRRQALAADYDGIEQFFIDEYALNRIIARYPKPYVSLVSGICMGGGIGLSVHGTFRVATEAAVFAMPETAIGLFPDVGATHFLPRLRGDWGLYMGLSGARVIGQDAVWVGLATHFVPKDRLEALLDALSRDGVGVLAEFAQPPAATEAPDVAAFALPSVAAILARLGATPGAWAESTLLAMRQASPSALMWTFEILRRGAGLTLEQCQGEELSLTGHVVRHPDFSEGVRAMVVDKDRRPVWSPGTVEEIDPAVIEAMFS